MAVLLRRFLTGLLFVLVSHFALAEVRINEVSATANEWELKWDGTGHPSLGAGPAWWNPSFVPATPWNSATAPIGWHVNEVTTDLTPHRPDSVSTLYLIKEFTVTIDEIKFGSHLELEIDFSDGFIAYLNGQEIGRHNMGPSGMHMYAKGTAYNTRTAGSPPLLLNLGPTRDLLHLGTHTLAIQVSSRNAPYPLKIDASLRQTVGPSFVPMESNWNYFIGHIEPSGGFFEPVLLDNNPDTPEVEFVDWIEIHNDGDIEVDLTDWSLTDNVERPGKYVFPPGTTIGADQYLVLIADEHVGQTPTAHFLHTDFRLEKDGEYLGLFNASGNPVHQFESGYPTQHSGYSYGFDRSNNSFAYLETPTPGRENAGDSLASRIDRPAFSVHGGFYDTPVTLAISCDTPDALIRYTTDGAEPTEHHGHDYESPLTLETIDDKTGHVIRARAFLSGHIPSAIESHTFLIGQHQTLQDYPTVAIAGNNNVTFAPPYGVLAIEGGIRDIQGRWTAQEGDDFNNPIRRGRTMERPCVFEFYSPSTAGSRIDAGIRMAGSTYSRNRVNYPSLDDSPWLSDWKQKPSFNVFFRNDYGGELLCDKLLGPSHPINCFSELRLRAGHNDIKNPFIKDELVRRLYKQMGHASSTGIFNSLYINGSFKGYYNMVERLREPFMRDHHGGMEAWDIRQVDTFAEGDRQAWDAMASALSKDLTIEENWSEALKFFDPINVADYFLLNIYAATNDWPVNNWVTARERSPEGKFRLYVWDAEGAFGHVDKKPVDYDTVELDLLQGTRDLPLFFQALHRSPEWRQIFTERAQMHFFGGALDDRDALTSSFNRLRSDAFTEFQALFRLVHGGGIFRGWFDRWTDPALGRRSHLIGPNQNLLGDHGLWRPIPDAPSLDPPGAEGSKMLSFTTDGSDPIYYTTDGSDPRMFGGELAPDAAVFSSTVPLEPGIYDIRARAQSSDGAWSSLTEGRFVVGAEPASTLNLTIVEVHYNPHAPTAAELEAGFSNNDDFEFLQLENIGTRPVLIDALSFTDGVRFDFASADIDALPVGGRAILSPNRTAFEHRYGAQFERLFVGEYAGNLSNGGEELQLENLEDDAVIAIEYRDSNPWPTGADGYGPSLQIVDIRGNVSDPLNWIASRQIGGMPGGFVTQRDFDQWSSLVFNPEELLDPATSGKLMDPDRDGLSNYVEFALGTLPHIADPQILTPHIHSAEAGKFLQIDYSEFTGASGVVLSSEFSSDLVHWLGSEEEATETNQDPSPDRHGCLTRIVTDETPMSAGSDRYARLAARRYTPPIPFSIVSISIPAPGACEIKWASKSGATYEVFRLDSTNHSIWRSIGSNIQSQGRLTTFTDSATIGRSHTYRIVGPAE